MIILNIKKEMKHIYHNDEFRNYEVKNFPSESCGCDDKLIK